MSTADLINQINDEIFEPVKFDEYQVLAINVLRRALLDVFAEPLAAETEQELGRVRSEALSWFLVDKKAGFTFKLVCDLLEIDRGVTLQRVKRWIEKGSKGEI